MKLRVFFLLQTWQEYYVAYLKVNLKCPLTANTVQNTRKETVRSHRISRFHLKREVGKRNIKIAFILLISRKYCALLYSSEEEVTKNSIILYPTKVSPSLKTIVSPAFSQSCINVQDDRVNIRDNSWLIPNRKEM